jgi:hypothetical protein
MGSNALLILSLLTLMGSNPQTQPLRLKLVEPKSKDAESCTLYSWWLFLMLCQQVIGSCKVWIQLVGHAVGTSVSSTVLLHVTAAVQLTAMPLLGLPCSQSVATSHCHATVVLM